jgi:glycosyltransferase involved in cell wall biosynthesis
MIIKPIIDMSLVGIGRSGYKCGLVRVAENFAFQLVQSPECEPAFCCTLSFETWVNTFSYLEKNPTYAGLFYAHQKFDRKGYAKSYDAIYHFLGLCYRLNLNKLLPYTLRSFFESQFHALSLSNLEESNIFHSIYHRIPKAIKSVRTIQKFITVHDLIPMLYPKLCGLEPDVSGFDRNFDLKQSLDSIDPDTWVFCVSNSTKNDLCDYLKNRIDPNKISVTPLAASELFYPCYDLEKISLIKQKYSIPNAPYILCLSTLEPRKNIEHTIQCFVNLVRQEKLEDLYLVIAGAKGWLYDTIFETIENASQIKKQIIVTGYIADEDLSALYSGALVFVYPSLYEGFGLPPLEAMQCGTPVITSNTSSLPEVVGDAGITIDPTDKDLLCQHLLKIYRDSSWQTELSRRSIERAKHFSWSKFTQKTIAAYKKSLS